MKVRTVGRLVQALGLVIVVGIYAQACGATARHTAVVASGTAYEALADIHAYEQQALCGQPSCAGNSRVEAVPGWTAAKSQAFNQKLLPAVEAGRQYNQLLASWKSGQPVPQQVVAAVQGIGAALSAVTADFPAGTTRTTILADLATAQGIFISTFEIVLAVKGGLQ